MAQVSDSQSRNSSGGGDLLVATDGNWLPLAQAWRRLALALLIPPPLPSPGRFCLFPPPLPRFSLRVPSMRDCESRLRSTCRDYGYPALFLSTNIGLTEYLLTSAPRLRDRMGLVRPLSLCLVLTTPAGCRQELSPKAALLAFCIPDS
ncbi:uncharacterized protein UV8b_02957 [Ustilaginoidea virens]|uniref:Uncharacterized protein n=1 Tax=Ustilaginoidea virens TaxID=1159556 RepID=A0A8E5HNM4_USTVR|nr:uncharacterized protein UV8b_02957 [Ustilaginoidea virens]QUC18716.1 hypothetical protein UV8b_02957 [Ustilaginoidea virens]